MSEDDLGKLIGQVAARVAARHRFVEQDDLAQELHLYALAQGRAALKYAADDQERARILRNAAIQYVKTRQIEAANFGWQFEDLAWYSPGLIADLLPLALSDDFDGSAPDDESEARHRSTGHESGGLLAMVMDVRRALAACPAAAHVLKWAEPSSDDGRDALAELSDFLGGEFPFAEGYGGRRRAASRQRQEGAL